jgi:hypothetical protein
MLATIWQPQWWLTAVGPNIVAAALCAVPAAIAAKVKLLPAYRAWKVRDEEHRQRVRELHERLVKNA